VYAGEFSNVIDVIDFEKQLNFVGRSAVARYGL
jgi:hypothetical protein